MNAGPYGTPPEETPPATPPADAPPPQADVPPAAAPGPEAAAPEPGGYYPPPAYEAGPPPRRRSAGPLIAGVIIVVVLIAAIGGYIVGGYAFASARLSTANSAYNKVVGHMNGYNDTINGLSNQLTNADTASASASTLQSDKTVVAQIVAKSQAAQGQIDQDDASLQQADSGLHENEWLTLVRKSDIDKASTRIGHERKALAIAKEITADYVQIGAFYETFFDVAIDIEDLGTKAQASDITGASAADEKLKSDVAKAITQDKAPGLPTQMDTLLKDLQALANDFSNLINAKDSASQTAAETALQSDGTKVQNFDYNQLSTAVHDYYQPLIDSFNSEVDKANNT